MNFPNNWVLPCTRPSNTNWGTKSEKMVCFVSIKMKGFHFKGFRLWWQQNMCMFFLSRTARETMDLAQSRPGNSGSHLCWNILWIFFNLWANHWVFWEVLRVQSVSWLQAQSFTFGWDDTDMTDSEHSNEVDNCSTRPCECYSKACLWNFPHHLI